LFGFGYENYSSNVIHYWFTVFLKFYLGWRNVVLRQIVLILFYILSSGISKAQYIQRGNKLVGSDAKSGDYSGFAVSLSGDGNSAIIGTTDGAYVFVQTNNRWIQQSKLIGVGNSGEAGQGLAVSISADGNTAIVGGPSDSASVGAAWVFTRVSGIWMQKGNKIVGGGSVGTAKQGFSVAISGDGNTAILGGPGDNGNTGAAWAFIWNNGMWQQQGEKIVSIDNVGNAYQAYSVASSFDGNTIILGSYQIESGYPGAAWIFVRSGNSWSQQGSKLVGTGSLGSPSLGHSVSISSDGNTVALGGWADNNYLGATWIFIRSGESWFQQGEKLVGAGGVGSSEQGVSVSLSGNGNTIVIGGIGDDGYNGAFWNFNRINGVWAQVGPKFIATDGIGGPNLGISSGISLDGSTICVGGNYDNSYTGAAWIFQKIPVLGSMNGVFKPFAPNPGENLNFKLTVFNSQSEASPPSFIFQRTPSMMLLTPL
jgi:hypothetical protein